MVGVVRSVGMNRLVHLGWFCGWCWILMASMGMVQAQEATPTIQESCFETAPTGWVEYTIQYGDTLSQLSFELGVPVGQLQQVNCLADGNILVGQRLFVPLIPPSPTAMLTPTPFVTVALIQPTIIATTTPIPAAISCPCSPTTQPIHTAVEQPATVEVQGVGWGWWVLSVLGAFIVGGVMGIFGYAYLSFNLSMPPIKEEVL